MKVELVIDAAATNRALKRAVERKKDIAKRRVYDAGDVFENEALNLAPEDSGELKRQMDRNQKVGRHGPEVRVGTTVEYGAFQEFGTSRNQAQPFIRPALQIAVRHLKARVR